MNTNDIQSKINCLPLGQEFDVKTLMADDWAAVEKKQGFGMRFKNAVRDGILSGVEHVRLANSPRRDIYKRI